MKLTINPAEIPFAIGDTVWVNQPCGETNQYPYFQAQIIQIILDGTLTNSIVIRKQGATHELLISTGVYDLNPSGDYARFGRVAVSVDFLTPQNTLFGSEASILSYQDRRNQVPPLLVEVTTPN